MFIPIKVLRKGLFLNAGFCGLCFNDMHESGAICYNVHRTECSLYPNLMMPCAVSQSALISSYLTHCDKTHAASWQHTAQGPRGNLLKF